MSRRYRPYQPTSKDTVDNIINNLKLDSLHQIDQLSDNDIDFLLEKLSSHDIEPLIQQHNHIQLNQTEIRNIKIKILLESLIYHGCLRNNIISIPKSTEEIPIETQPTKELNHQIPLVKQTTSRKRRPRQYI